MSVGKKEKKLTAVVGAVVGGFEGAGVGCIAQKQSISVVNNEQLSDKVSSLYHNKDILTSFVGAGVGGGVG